MSRYHALMNKRADLEKKRAAMVDDASATVEQMNALSAEIQANEDEIAAVEKLRQAEREAPFDGTAQRPLLTTNENLDPKAGFQSLAEMALCVRQAVAGTRQIDKRLDAIASGAAFGATAPTYHQETQSTEGWEVPPEFRQAIWELTYDGTDLMSLLEMEPTNSNSVEMSADETTPWGSSGVQARWRVEAEQMTASTTALSGKRTEVNELYAFVAATEELLADAPRLQSRLTRKAAAAIEWTASEAFAFGDGVGKPKGWSNSDALITVGKESGQAADTLNTKNLGKMYSRLYFGSGAQPMWLANSTILPQLLEMTIGQVPVWVPQNEGFKGKPGGLLLGLPLVFNEHNPGLGELHDIQLVNLAGYYACNRSGGPQYAESIHLWFDTGKKAFRWTFRLGGRPIMSAPIQPPSGKNSQTKSHFVTLEAR